MPKDVYLPEPLESLVTTRTSMSFFASDNNVSEKTSRFALPNSLPASNFISLNSLKAFLIPLVPVGIADHSGHGDAMCDHSL